MSESRDNKNKNSAHSNADKDFTISVLSGQKINKNHKQARKKNISDSYEVRSGSA